MGLMIVITSCQDYCHTLLTGLPISIFGLLKAVLHKQLGHFLNMQIRPCASSV